MRLFLWERVARLTDEYHGSGGLVVIAADEARARAIANERLGKSNADRDGKPCSVSDDEVVDYQVVVGDDIERVFIFPDAGCC